jgi:RNA recognition motif-containing protein
MRRSKRKILFVGGIPSAMSEESIQRHFEQFGAVLRTKIMRDKKSKAAKGYAFVTMASHQHLAKIALLDHVIEGRKVDCQIASKKGEKKKWQDKLKKRRVFVTGLPNCLSNEDLISLFSNCGQVRNGFVIHDFATKTSKGYGYVEFMDQADALKALNSEVNFKGKKIICQSYVGRHEPKRSYCQSTEPYEALYASAAYLSSHQPRGMHIRHAFVDSGDEDDSAEAGSERDSSSEESCSNHSSPCLPEHLKNQQPGPPRRKSDKRPSTQHLTLCRFLLEQDSNYRFNKQSSVNNPSLTYSIVFVGRPLDSLFNEPVSPLHPDQSHPHQGHPSPLTSHSVSRYLAPGEGHASPESQ